MHHVALIHPVVDEARDGEAVIFYSIRTASIVTWGTQKAQQRSGFCRDPESPRRYRRTRVIRRRAGQRQNEDFFTADFGTQPARSVGSERISGFGRL